MPNNCSFISLLKQCKQIFAANQNICNLKRNEEEPGKKHDEPYNRMMDL